MLIRKARTSDVAAVRALVDTYALLATLPTSGELIACWKR